MVGIIRDFRFLEPVRASFLFWLGSNRESRIESHTPIQITNVTGKKKQFPIVIAIPVSPF